MPMTAKEKAENFAPVMFFLAIVLLIIGVSLGVGWSYRGLDHANYVGIGQARILNVTTDRHYTKQHEKTYYDFNLRITAGNMTFDAVQRRESRNDWNEGDVLAIVYNVKDPHKFVLDITPEELVKWDGSIGLCAAASLIAALLCLLRGLKIKRMAEDEEAASV